MYIYFYILYTYTYFSTKHTEIKKYTALMYNFQETTAKDISAAEGRILSLCTGISFCF